MPSDKSDDSGSEHHDELPASLSLKASAAKDAASLKRGREGSLEPYPTEQPISQAPSMTTKKNRLAPTSSPSVPTTGQPPSKPLDTETSPNLDMSGSIHSNESLQPGEVLDKLEDRVDVGQPGKEAGNIGEVRRKVAEMTHGEGNRDHGDMDEDEGKVTISSMKEGASKSAISTSTNGTEAQHGDTRDGDTHTRDGDDWENIERSEASGAGDVATNGDADGLKRKALDRSESSFFKDGDSPKRLKDTPSPPLDTIEKTQTIDDTSTPQVEKSVDTANTSGPTKKPQATFASFSSSASPFSAKGSASPFASGSTTSAPKPFSTSGFGAFSSTSSPFAKKPPTSVPKPVDDDSTDTAEKEDKKDEEPSRAGPSTFGDILQQENAVDEEGSDRVQMTTKDVTTGEESEETLYSGRAKLFSMEPDGGWRERGVGALKLNVRKSDRKGARLVMRAEGVLRLILNASLYVGMPCLEDGKHVRTTVFEEGERKFVTFRTGSAKAATELANAIHDHIPLESNNAASSKSPEAFRGSAGEAV